MVEHSRGGSPHQLFKQGESIEIRNEVKADEIKR
jgi:hypothetical protein